MKNLMTIKYARLIASLSICGLAPAAGCTASDSLGIGDNPDSAVTTQDVAVVAETAPGPQPAPTLETGVDRAALAAAVTTQVIQFFHATQPDLAADTIQLGRPWGEFDLHKGPRLVFRGSWSMLASISGNYFAIVNASRDGDSYKMISIGSAQFVPTMVALETRPGVSAALDRGRAAFLRCVGEGGDSLLAYEAEAVADAGQSEIRVQPLGMDTRFQGIDASAPGVAEMSLDELDPLLPAE